MWVVEAQSARNIDSTVEWKARLAGCRPSRDVEASWGLHRKLAVVASEEEPEHNRVGKRWTYMKEPSLRVLVDYRVRSNSEAPNVEPLCQFSLYLFR